MVGEAFGAIRVLLTRPAGHIRITLSLQALAHCIRQAKRHAATLPLFCDCPVPFPKARVDWNSGASSALLLLLLIESDRRAFHDDCRTGAQSAGRSRNFGPPLFLVDWLEIGLELLPPVFFPVTVAVVIPAIKAATTMAILAVVSLWFLTQTRTLDRVNRIGGVGGIRSIGPSVFFVTSGSTLHL